MTLRGWTQPQTPTGRSALVTPPPWHYSGEVIQVDFDADPQAVADLCPAGFVPAGRGECSMVFCDWCSAADRDSRVLQDPVKGQYREAYVAIWGSFDGRPAGRIPFLWVDSELSFLRGLIQGFPKKMGDIYMTRPVELGRGGARRAQGHRFSAHASALARRLVTASVELDHPTSDGNPRRGPLVHTRLWPSIESAKPTVEEWSFVDIRDVEIANLWSGNATLTFGPSDFDEVNILEPAVVRSGWVFSMAFSVYGGRTHTYDDQPNA